MAQHFYNHKLHNQETFSKLRKSYLLARLKVVGIEWRAIPYQDMVRIID